MGVLIWIECPHSWRKLLNILVEQVRMVAKLKVYNSVMCLYRVLHRLCVKICLILG